MTTPTRTELENRARRVQTEMQSGDPAPDAFIIIQTADLFWLSATTQTSHLVLPAHGEPRLLVRKILERAQRESPLADIRALRSLKELPDHLRELCGDPPWRIGMELDVIPANLARTYSKVLGDSTEIVDASATILRARSVKSELEVDELRAAGDMHEQVFARFSEVFEPGISCYHLQSRLDGVARELGHCGIIRMRGLDVWTGIGIIVSGEESTVPSHSHFPIGGPGPCPWVASGGGGQAIERDMPIIADYLISRTGYHADCTRMAVWGSFPDEAAEILEQMRKLLRFCEHEMKAGSIPSEIYSCVLDLAGKAGLGENFMGPGSLGVKFIGHSVGLEVNETPVLAPRFDTPLEEGNTIAIEPKYTHPKYGVIGIENTYAVRKNGLENLTDCPEDVFEIEA